MNKDVKNYMQYKMGFSKKIFMVDGATPTKFDCQQDRKRRLCDADSSRDKLNKRQRMEIIKEFEEEIKLRDQVTLSHVREILNEILENAENIIEERNEEVIELESEDCNLQGGM